MNGSLRMDAKKNIGDVSWKIRTTKLIFTVRKKNTHSGMLIGKSREPNSYRNVLKSKEAG